MITPSARLAPYFTRESTEVAGAVVRRYFTPRPAGRFTGAHFDRLGGGGDRPAVADEFTADDLIAVSMLSVPVVGDAALEILVHRRNRLSELLRLIPTDTPLSAVPADAIEPGWPAWRLYTALRQIGHIGPTTASKLLARKRPHLVPVYDTVVAAELNLADGRLWQPLHAWLVANEHANDTQLARIRDSAGLGGEISLLRVFDVLTWMVGKGYDNAPPPASDAPVAV
jgi:hypothetical protein